MNVSREQFEKYVLTTLDIYKTYDEHHINHKRQIDLLEQKISCLFEIIKRLENIIIEQKSNELAQNNYEATVKEK